ncbi:hypothetical protein [Hyalangium gracile]|uniref:hypothetical protein n=1 Tax=Hyalangium gracile TaxID=394092 RepID=UPI001CC939BA|nr:hypothetical protein [Hyalangium gracile]
MSLRLPLALLPFLLALVPLERAEASCSVLSGEDLKRCLEAGHRSMLDYHDAYEKSVRFEVSVGSHTQQINLFDYKRAGLCALTMRDSVTPWSLSRTTSTSTRIARVRSTSP